jgi:hypothetical protein
MDPRIFACALSLSLGLTACRSQQEQRHSDVEDLVPSSALDHSEGRTDVPSAEATDTPDPAENPDG